MIARQVLDLRGGGIIRGIRATWPFVRLRIDESRLEISMLRKRYRLDLEEIDEARIRRFLPLTKGIQFHHSCPGAPSRLVFFGNTDLVEEALVSQGVRVSK